MVRDHRKFLEHLGSRSPKMAFTESSILLLLGIFLCGLRIKFPQKREIPDMKNTIHVCIALAYSAEDIQLY
jgi:hypothetical protein